MKLSGGGVLTRIRDKGELKERERENSLSD